MTAVILLKLLEGFVVSPLALSEFLSILSAAVIVVTLGYWLWVSVPTREQSRIEDFSEPLRRLRVPRSWWRSELLWFQYFAHLAVAALLFLGTGWWFTLGAVGSLAIFGLYAVVVVQAYLSQSSCQCFHDGQVTSRRDLVRAAVLVVASVIAVLGAFGAVAATLGGYGQTLLWRLMAALVVAAAMVVGASISPQRQPSDPSLFPEAAPAVVPAAVPEGTDAAASSIDEEPGEYLSTPVPRVMIIDPEGNEVPLGTLVNERPALVFIVNPDCGGCLQVVDRLGDYAERLPEIQLVVLATAQPQRISAPPTVSVYEDRNSVVYWLLSPATPSAFLMAPSQSIVGGPVYGPAEIASFVEDIRTELDSVVGLEPGTPVPGE